MMYCIKKEKLLLFLHSVFLIYRDAIIALHSVTSHSHPLLIITEMQQGLALACCKGHEDWRREGYCGFSS